MIEKIVSAGGTGPRAPLPSASSVLSGDPARQGGGSGTAASRGTIRSQVARVAFPIGEPGGRCATGGTLIRKRLRRHEAGVKKTANFTEDWNRPCYNFAEKSLHGIGNFREFLAENSFRNPTVAGSGEPGDPGTGRRAGQNLLEILSEGTSHTGNTTEGTHYGDADDRGNDRAGQR